MGEIIIAVVDSEFSLVAAPPGTRIELRDYDVPEDWDPNNTRCDRDAMGDRYERVILERS